MRTCNQCERNCEGATNCQCFSCGLPVCKNCSKLIEYLHYGIKRICHSCLDPVEEPMKRKPTPDETSKQTNSHQSPHLESDSLLGASRQATQEGEKDMRKRKRWCVWVRWPHQEEFNLALTFEDTPNSNSAKWRAERFCSTRGGPQGEMLFASFVEMRHLPEGRKPKPCGKGKHAKR